MFSYNLKKLQNQAMTNLNPAAREQLLLHKFLAGLPPSVSRLIRGTGEARELEQAVECACLLMAISEQEHTAAIPEDLPEDPSKLQQLRKQVQDLTEHVAALTTQRHDEHKQQPYRCCFKCNQTGHLQRNCTCCGRSRPPGGLLVCFNCNRTPHKELPSGKMMEGRP